MTDSSLPVELFSPALYKFLNSSSQVKYLVISSFNIGSYSLLCILHTKDNVDKNSTSVSAAQRFRLNNSHQRLQEVHPNKKKKSFPFSEIHKALAIHCHMLNQVPGREVSGVSVG